MPSIDDRHESKELFFLRKACCQVVKREELPGKRDVSQVSQDRHLEDGPKAKNWNIIGPFRKGVEIPEFPEKSADQASKPQGDKRPPVAPFDFGQQRPIPKPDVQGVQDEKNGKPNKRIEVIRPKHKDQEHHTACNEKDSRNSGGQTELRPVFGSFDS